MSKINIKKLDKIVQYMSESGIELVSYGLAPNPNGFCYETSDETTKANCLELNDMLASLTKAEEKQLIMGLF